MEFAKKKCGICGAGGSNLRPNLVTLKTKFSGTTVYQLMERFIEYDLSELGTDMAESAACNECYAKLNDYDAAYTKALIIQKELLDLLKNSPLGIAPDLEVLDYYEYEEEMDSDSQVPLREVDKVEKENDDPQPKSLRSEEAGGATLLLQGQLNAEESTPSSGVSWKCNACGQQFKNLSEMQEHKHLKVENDSDDTNEPDLSIESLQSPYQDETGDIMEESDDIQYDTADDGPAAAFIIEKLDEEDIESLEELPAKTKRSRECYYCDEFFSFQESFKEHMDTVHSMENGQHKCKICGFLAKTRAALCNHFSTHFRAPIKCKICQKEFHQKATLVRHMAIHTRKTAYSCKLCDKSYIHYSSYYMHQLAHHNIRSKKCEICGYELRSTSHLKRHMRTHSGEKPFECPECGQKFSQRYNMITHLNGHKGITRKTARTFICKLCDKRSDRKMMLRQHLQVEHGISSETELEKSMQVDIAGT
ncbi:zinc finger protein 107-like [Anopheles ziemanni]|uniref:zinc finger protein 107-like n=1 Tax=Anopheles coustani TaxID=139045 RepID=UPI002658B2DF|nr:zinc finger protein 107-like [Anopheles coustani]XP_058169480.1 zinc finger protein 107-like [Anopheles ziemanni]